MSDGDGKDSLKFTNEKDNLQSSKKKKSANDFSQAVARVAVAQVCEGLGFQSCQQSALDTFVDVGVRYIKEIGKTASFYANLANRTQCNVFDVIQGLEDLGSGQGFSGASDVSHSLTGSGVIQDIIRYVGGEEEIPFAYLVPSFPVVKEKRLNPSFAQEEENSPDEHIPNWLPKFLNPGASVDNNTIQQVDCNLEGKLQNAQQNVILNGSDVGVADTLKAQRAVVGNPFLAPPLQCGEKDVLLPVLPPKLLEGHNRSREVLENHISTVGLTLLANEAETSVTFETEERRRSPLNGRPNVQFKFGNMKKSLGTNKSLRNEGKEKISLWFANDDNHGKDEKKIRAEQIVRENMEYSQELSHL